MCLNLALYGAIFSGRTNIHFKVWWCYFYVISAYFLYLRFPSLIWTCVFRRCVLHPCATALAFSILTYSIPGTYAFRTYIFEEYRVYSD